MNPAVVVLGYERPQALQRLLLSLQGARYPQRIDVPLVISLDRSQTPAGRETAAVAHAFSWRHGTLEVIEQPEHLGVVGHFLVSGDLSRQYGSIVLLEDDLTVSPAFYAFASGVLEAYSDEIRIAGCCLYGLWFNGFTLDPFTPIEDGNDVFFLGVPHTQGLCFSAAQWARFRGWQRDGRVEAHAALHPAFLNFGLDEWFPSLAAFLAVTGACFCFPRVSLTTGWGDAGAHFQSSTSWFQTPLQLGSPALRLSPLDEALAVYDGFFELLPDRLRRLAPSLEGLEFDTDLNATKQQANLQHDLVLTSRRAASPLRRFGLEMTPPELNVIADVPGEALVLARRGDVRWDEGAGKQARARLHALAWRRYRPSLRRALRHALARLPGLRALGR